MISFVVVVAFVQMQLNFIAFGIVGQDKKTSLFHRLVKNTINRQKCSKPILKAKGKLRRTSWSSSRATTLFVKG